MVTIDEQSHTVSYSSEYYQLGQVGAFVRPGAMRIDSPNFVTYGLNSSNIETVSSGLAVGDLTVHRGDADHRHEARDRL